VLAEKRAGGKGGRAAAAALKELGAHPGDGQPVRILSGRFGPYIKHGSVNANVPRGKDPQAVTLEEAVGLLAERAAKGGGKKPARKAAAKKPDAMTAKTVKAKKKPAAKKKTTARKSK
jgi:DNA topoisomerase-1